MEDTAYGMRVRVPVPYDEAVDRVTAALKHEGFGLLTSIDVKQTLEQKLDVDFRRYVILGACNPPLAHRALGSAPKRAAASSSATPGISSGSNGQPDRGACIGGSAGVAVVRYR